jgi:c-di-GMP phosphodiesterase
VPSESDVNDSVFVGRRPLFDAERRTVAYELFTRDGLDDDQPFDTRERAARRLVSVATHRVGIDELVGGHEVWVAVTDGFLRDGHHASLPAKRTVLELLPESWANESSADDIDWARRAGYRAAWDARCTGRLSDERSTPHVPTNPAEIFDRAKELGVLKMVDAVIVDPHGWSEALCMAFVRHAEFLSIQTLGVVGGASVTPLSSFHLRSGRHPVESVVGPLAEQTGTTEGHVPIERGDRLAAMQLIAELERPNASFEDVEKIIVRDPSLSLRILALANSGLFSLPKRIASVHSALLMLGLRNVRQMALMVALTSVANVPREATIVALVRARQCELLADSFANKAIQPEVGFTVGLLSLVSVFAGLSTADALAKLPVTNEIRDAVLAHQGVAGQVLRGALASERGEIGEFLRSGVAETFTTELLASTYLNALSWAERMKAGVAGA